MKGFANSDKEGFQGEEGPKRRVVAACGGTPRGKRWRTSATHGLHKGRTHREAMGRGTGPDVVAVRRPKGDLTVE